MLIERFSHYGAPGNIWVEIKYQKGKDKHWDCDPYPLTLVQSRENEVQSRYSAVSIEHKDPKYSQNEFSDSFHKVFNVW